MPHAAGADDLSSFPITSDLKLALDGAWLDYPFRCMPAHSAHGTLTVLVQIDMWERIASKRNGDIGEANRELAQLAMHSGRWASYNDSLAIMLVQLDRSYRVSA